MKVYLSHRPEDESSARRIAEDFKSIGIEAVVAADIRPRKCFEDASEEDLLVVKKEIESCDAFIVVC